MAVRITVNGSAFRAMAVGEEIRAAVTAEAKRAQEIAKGIAEDFRVSGEYEDGLGVYTTNTRLNTGFGSHDVATGVLLASAPHSAAVEWGNKHDSKAHHVLGRTLAALHE